MKKLVLSAFLILSLALSACAPDALPGASPDMSAPTPKAEHSTEASIPPSGTPDKSAAPSTEPTPEEVPESTPEPTSAPSEPTPEPTPEPPEPGDIPTSAVDSSCFSEVGYDETAQTLVVIFRDSGAKYAYFGFTPDDWAAFLSAPSLGRYYNASIKGSFECERID